MATVIVRPTTAGDRSIVLDVVRRAFRDASRDGREEVEIVETTWALAPPGDIIDLAAVAGDVIVGHVLAAPGSASGMPVLAVAPLAVAPRHQGCGVGSTLMAELLRRADEAGWPAAVLLGNPDYYRRFGFEPAWTLGVVYPPEGTESPNFQLRRLRRYRPSVTGTFWYVWEPAHDNP